MRKARQRKRPVTGSETGGTSSRSSQSSRTVIRQFHFLLKRRAQLQISQTHVDNSKALADIEGQITQLGGLEAYQQMSAIGQRKDRGGGSETVLINWLKGLRLNLQKPQTRLQLLEVGALEPDNYKRCLSWIDATPIDLRPRHRSILQQDFLLLDETQHHERWDVVTLSLVLNFVPDARDRGRMLRLAHHILRLNGCLFLALPLQCVANSRYLTFVHLKSIMETIGFSEVKNRWRKDGKMAYWLYQKKFQASARIKKFEKKTVLCQGDRNNFCLLL